jgi:hypothetical protein
MFLILVNTGGRLRYRVFQIKFVQVDTKDAKIKRQALAFEGV